MDGIDKPFRWDLQVIKIIPYFTRYSLEVHRKFADRRREENYDYFERLSIQNCSCSYPELLRLQNPRRSIRGRFGLPAPA